MFHPASDYGKIQKLLDSNYCICDLESKQVGHLLGKRCFSTVLRDKINLIRKTYSDDRSERFEAYMDILEFLGYLIKDIR